MGGTQSADDRPSVCCPCKENSRTLPVKHKDESATTSRSTLSQDGHSWRSQRAMRLVEEGIKATETKSPQVFKRSVSSQAAHTPSDTRTLAASNVSNNSPPFGDISPLSGTSSITPFESVSQTRRLFADDKISPVKMEEVMENTQGLKRIANGWSRAETEMLASNRENVHPARAGMMCNAHGRGEDSAGKEGYGHEKDKLDELLARINKRIDEAEGITRKRLSHTTAAYNNNRQHYVDQGSSWPSL